MYRERVSSCRRSPVHILHTHFVLFHRIRLYYFIFFFFSPFIFIPYLFRSLFVPFGGAVLSRRSFRFVSIRQLSVVIVLRCCHKFWSLCVSLFIFRRHSSSLRVCFFFSFTFFFCRLLISIYYNTKLRCFENDSRSFLVVAVVDFFFFVFIFFFISSFEHRTTFGCAFVYLCTWYNSVTLQRDFWIAVTHIIIIFFSLFFDIIFSDFFFLYFDRQLVNMYVFVLIEI